MIALVGAIVAAIATTGVAIAVAGLRGVVSSDRTRIVDVTGAVRRFGFAAVSMAVVTLATGWPMAGAAAAGIAMLVPLLVSTRSSRQHDLERSDALASWVEMLRDTIAGHAGLQQAIALTAEVAPDPIRVEVRRLAVDVQRFGLTAGLRRFATAMADPIADMIVAALAIAADHQARHLTDLLGDIAASARKRTAMRLRIETGRARTYASARWIVGLTLLMAIGLVVFSPDFMDPYDGLAGQVVLGIVGGLFVGAVAGLVTLSRPTPLPRVLAGVEA